MRSNKGITLVALVITIIVLIILAGVTINILMDQNGLITKTREAAKLADEERVKERITLLLAEYEIKQGTENQTLTDFLTEKLGVGEIDNIQETAGEFIVEAEGYEFTVSKSTREITNVSTMNVKISISYPEGTTGATAKAIVTAENNEETLDTGSLAYGWSSSRTAEPTTWTSFDSGDTLTQAVEEGQTCFLWVRANYIGGTTGTENERISISFYNADSTPPTGNVSRNPSTTTVDPLVVATITTSEEIETPSGWTKTSATTYTKNYTSNTTENVSITDLFGNIGSVTVTVSNIFELPAGFTISAVAGETDIATGLVVNATADGSQFVWVAVPNPVLDVQGMNDTQINTALAAEVTAGRYPMAVKVNATDYKGVLYDFSGTTSVIIAKRTYSSTTGYREPAYLTDGTYGDASSYNTVGITQILLQNDYNAMVNSVIARGGFFIGRYETSVRTGSIVQSKSGLYPMRSVNWFTMYDRQKKYATNNSISSITSHMIYGSQWHQVMIWMRDVPNPGKTKPFYILDSTGMGNYSGGIANAGSNSNYKVKNIYDMAGNVWDWTQTANASSQRMLCGGRFDNVPSTSPASTYTGNFPHLTSADFGSRMAFHF